MIDRISESNSNTGLYAAGAAVVGGGAGAAAGWYSRPFLKKGEADDKTAHKICGICGICAGQQTKPTKKGRAA